MKCLKSLCLIVIFVVTMIMGTLSWARETLLVLDMRNVAALPKHFRTSADPIKTTAPPDLTGLANLNVAGSAQFSKIALFKVLEHLHTKHLTIIDLRQESHGFLNGNAISWYGFQNAANAGKTAKQIEAEEVQQLLALSQLKSVKVNKILNKGSNENIDQSSLIEFRVHKLASEEELLADAHLSYRRIFVEDFHAPSEHETNRFIQLIKQLPPKEWIYFHCRAGIGRTTTFMIMYDMLRNAKHVSFDAILARQTLIGGKEMRELPANNWKKQYAALRLDFLKKFYVYARQNQDHFETPFKLNRTP